MYLFMGRAIKQIVVIIEAYHFCQLHTKFIQHPAVKANSICRGNYWGSMLNLCVTGCALSIASFIIYNYKCTICITGALCWDCKIIIYSLTMQYSGYVQLTRPLDLSSRIELFLEVLHFMVFVSPPRGSGWYCEKFCQNLYFLVVQAKKQLTG